MTLRSAIPWLSLAGAAVIAGCADGPTAPDRSPRIVKLGSGIHPDIAGQHVVWQRHSGTILHLNLATGRLDTLTGADGSSQVGHATVHGDRAAWMEWSDSGTSVVLTSLEGSHLVEVIDGSARDRFPRLSEELLVWERRGRSDADIFMKELGAAGENRIAPSPDQQIQPKVDGHRVVWTQFIRGETGRADYRVRLFDAETGAVLSLTEDDRSHGTPDVSGDVVVWVDPGGDIQYRELRGSLPVRSGSVDTEASFPAVSAPWIVWVNRDDDRNIWAHNIESDETFPVSSNRRLPGFPQISGDRVVWHEAHPDGAKVMSATLD